jgi:hypothetical protein
MWQAPNCFDGLTTPYSSVPPVRPLEAFGISILSGPPTRSPLARMFVLKNSRLEKTLYTGAFNRAAPRKKLQVLFAYVDEEQCTSFFDNCYVSCEVTADDVIRLVGIEGGSVRIIDDSFEETCYTSKDVVFSI